MAEELILKIKVETSDGGKKLQDVEQDMQKIKKSAKETSDGIGIADTKIGKMWSTFTTGTKMGIASMRTLAGAVAATGIGLLLIAIAGVVNYFKNTKEGANILEIAMKTLGVIIREGPIFVFKALKVALEAWLLPMKTGISIVKGFIDVMSGKKGLKEAIGDVRDTFQKNTASIVEHSKALGADAKLVVDRAVEEARIAKMRIALADGERKDMVDEAKLISEITDLREQALDMELTAIQRKEKFSEALKKNNELYQIQHEHALETLAIADAEIKNGDRSIEALDAQAEARKNLFQIENDYSKGNLKLIKGQNKAEKEELKSQATDAKEREKQRKDDLKTEEDLQKEIRALRNETVLAAMDGHEKEQTALDQKFEEDKRKYTENEEYQMALSNKFVADSIALQKKYDDEKTKADKDAADKAYDLKLKDLEDTKKTEEEKLKIKQDYLSKGLDIEMEANTYKYERGEETQKEYLDRERELKLEQADVEITDEKELQQAKDAIKAEYDQKDFKRKEDLQGAIMQGAIQGATMIANGVFDIQKQQLDKQKEKELANKNLTEEQKAAINKKYAEKQKKLDMKQAIITGALAILGGFASKPFIPVGIIAGALATIATAVQIATIAKTQYASGGIVVGRPHESGGVDVNLQGGEGVVNASAMKNPLITQQVMSLNANSSPNAIPQNSGINSEEIAKIVVQSIKNIPVTVTEHQITQAQTNVAVRESRFSVV